MSLSEITWRGISNQNKPRSGRRTYIFMLKVLQQLQFSVCPLRQDWSAEGLHNLLHCNILSGKLIFCRAARPYQQSPFNSRRRRVYHTKPDQKRPFPLAEDQSTCATDQFLGIATEQGMWRRPLKIAHVP